MVTKVLSELGDQPKSESVAQTLPKPPSVPPTSDQIAKAKARSVSAEDSMMCGQVAKAKAPDMCSADSVEMTESKSVPRPKKRPRSPGPSVTSRMTCPPAKAPESVPPDSSSESASPDSSPTSQVPSTPVKAQETSGQKPNRDQMTTDEREKVNESLDWIITQSRLMWDELDAGVFYTEDAEFLTAMITDWRQLAAKVHEASEASTKCVAEIEKWVQARRQDLPGLDALKYESEGMAGNDFDVGGIMEVANHNQ